MIEPGNFFILRSPLMPVSTETGELFRTNALAREALFLASPTSLNELDKSEHLSESLKLTLIKYHKRISTRCTPFGLFAGVSLGHFADRTKYEFVSQQAYRRLTRFDGDATQMLVDNMLEKHCSLKQLRYKANDSIYDARQGYLRYIEGKDKGGVKQYQVSSVERSEYLQYVLDMTKELTDFHTIVEMLENFAEVEKDDAEAFIEQIIEAGILKSELEINVTGELYFDRVVSLVGKIGKSEELHQTFKELKARLHSLDQSFGIGQLKGYKEIESIISEKFAGLNIDNTQLFQVDLFKPAKHGALNKNVTTNIGLVVDILRRLSPAMRTERMADFVSHFTRKFGDSEMNLMELMDPDLGLGYPVNERRESDKAPLTDGLRPGSVSVPQPVSMQPIHIYLWNEFRKSFHDGDPIQLTEELVLPFYSPSSVDWPASFFSMGSLIAKSTDSIDSGDYFFDLEFATGPSIANMLARLALCEPELENLLRDELAREQMCHGERILAEVVHAPYPRVANIATRPSLRNYEIPILSTPSVVGDQIIRLEDLVVRVVDDRVILYSKRLKKQIVPRLSSAHNFRSDALPVYQFLCDLQFEEVNNTVKWEWGGMESLRFLPRIMFDNIIVSKARWYFDASATAHLLNGKADDIQESLRANKVPRQVLLLTNGDLKLKLDFTCDDDIKILLHYARLNKEITLIEDVGLDANWVLGPEGTFANEIIIPWSSNPTQRPAPEPFDKEILSKHSVGSPWFYFKIYSGVKVGEEVLLMKLAPMLTQMVVEGTIEQWFFIRYADPDFHIRLRCKGKGNFYNVIIERVNDKLSEEIKSQQIWNIQIESYQPEILRYGEKFIEYAEQMFSYDSYAVVDSLSLFNGDDRDEVRWQVAAIGVASYLDLFEIGVPERIELFRTLSQSFLKEFNLQNDKDQLKKKYRQFKNTLAALFSDECQPYVNDVKSIFQNRNDKIRELLNDAGISLITVGKSQSGNVIHMFLNRVFRSKPRFQEAVLYDFLHQYYKSYHAMQKHSERKIFGR